MDKHELVRIEYKWYYIKTTNFVAVILDDIKKLKDQMESLNSSYQQHAMQIEMQASQLVSLGTRGIWCAYKNTTTNVGTITYDRLLFSDYNNMEITGTPLDINTGIITVLLLLSEYSWYLRDLHCAHVWCMEN